MKMVAQDGTVGVGLYRRLWWSSAICRGGKMYNTGKIYEKDTCSCHQDNIVILC